MGMAASQARLLTLTSRLSDLELKAQQISNNKIRLAMDTEQVSKDYAASLDKEKLTILTGYNQSNPVYSDLNYNNLTGPDSPLMTQYGVSDANGRILVTQDVAAKFEQTKNSGVSSFLQLFGSTTTQTGQSPKEIAADELRTYANGVENYVFPNKWSYTVTTGSGTTGSKEADISALTEPLTTAINTLAGKIIETPINQTTVSSPSDYISNSIAPPVSAANQLYSDYSKYGLSGSGGTIPSYAAISCGQQLYSAINGITSQAFFTQSTDDTAKTYVQNAISSPLSAANQLKSGNGSNWSLLNSFSLSVFQDALSRLSSYSSTTQVGTDYSTTLQKEQLKTGLSSIRDLFDNVSKSALFSSQDLTDFIGIQKGTIGGFITAVDTSMSSDILKTVKNGLAGISIATLTQKMNAAYTGGSGGGTPITYSQDNPHGNLIKKGGSEIDRTEFDRLVSVYNNASDTHPILPSTTPVENPTYYTNLFNRMLQGYTTEPNETNTLNNPNWLQNQMMQGNLFLEKVDKDAKWNQISYTGDTNIVEKTDDKDMAKAEAKYQTDMASIQSKDKRFDVQLTKINTEHNAIQTEIDSVKKVIDKNIERSFKTFEA